MVLPEPLHELRVARAARRALGLSVERTRPEGVLRVDPRGREGAALVELRGPTLRLRLTLETVPGDDDAEVRLDAAGRARAPASPEPAPAVTAAVAPEPTAPPPVPAATPAATAPPPSPSPAPAVVFDVSNLMRATPIPIGRREGLPGQPAMVLVDALRGESHLWLRFTLEGGAAARVRQATWDRGPLTTFTQEAVGRDLRVVVQLPRAEVTRRTRVALAMDSGATYRFALSSGTLADLWRKIFN